MKTKSVINNINHTLFCLIVLASAGFGITHADTYFCHDKQGLLEIVLSENNQVYFSARLPQLNTEVNSAAEPLPSLSKIAADQRKPASKMNSKIKEMKSAKDQAFASTFATEQGGIYSFNFKGYVVRLNLTGANYTITQTSFNKPLDQKELNSKSKAPLYASLSGNLSCKKI